MAQRPSLDPGQILFLSSATWPRFAVQVEVLTFPSACLLGIPILMIKLIKVHPNTKRGRPATGKDPLVSARLPRTLIDRIEEWRAATHVSRSEAIRQLLEIGVKAPKSPRPAGRAIPSRATEPPAGDIEMISEHTSHPDERT
jgi:Ribbon-helix-helix protein, copG family